MVGKAASIAGRPASQKVDVQRVTEAPPGSYPGFLVEEIEGAIVDRFHKIVSLFPQRTAIETENGKLTYVEFNREANRLAHAILREFGDEDERVAFLLGYGFYPAVAIFGSLKAGKAYIPFDPSFPKSRLVYMLEDSQAGLLVTDNCNLELAKELARDQVKILNLDQLDPTLPAKNPGRQISPDAIAYILYTSGSSGQPKGVLQMHRNVLHNNWRSANNLKITPEDRFALVVSIGFAASNFAVYGSLLNGACLVQFDLKHDLPHLADWLAEEKITIFMAVPTLFRHFARSITRKDKYPHIRLIMLGGEAVLKSDVELFQKNFSPHCLLRNSLAGTEMGTIRTLDITIDTQIEDNVVPVGFPVPDREVLLLDEAGQEVPVGEPGEIVVRSRYLSPGYWRKPDLTRQKFQDLPDGSRLYRSGDLGRLREDGCMFHLGRKDFLVKMRGFRIELEEIEAVLVQHPGISEAVVVVDESGGQEKRLVAYLVPEKDIPFPSSEETRIYLKKNLPEYMVPFAFVVLEKLPLTATGKLDRRSLPTLAEVFSLEKEYVAPRDELERQLAHLWEELLEVRPIGIRNDFFRIGGHSLLAASLISQVEARFGKRIDLATMSGVATVEQLAEVIRKDGWRPSGASLVAIQEGNSRPALYCVHGIGGHILPFRTLASYLDNDQPVFGLQAQGVDGMGQPCTDLEAMARAYIQEIQGFQPEGPYLLGGFSFGGFVAYEMARQLEAQGERVALLAIFDTQVRAAPGFMHSLPKHVQIRFKIRSFTHKYGYHFQNARLLPPGQKLAYLRQGPGLPSPKEMIMGDVDEEEYRKVPDYLQKVMDGNIVALRGYLPKRYGGKVTLFKSRDHGKAVYYGWEELAAGGVEVFEVPGNHRGILQEPNIAILAAHLRACIDQAASNGASRLSP